MEHDFRYIFCSACGYRKAIPVSCGNRFCPVCSVARRSRTLKRLRAIINKVSPRRPYSTKHLTLTIPNSRSADAGAAYIVAAFRKLRQRLFWRRHVLGGAYALDITGSPGNWHVHIHCVLEAKFMPWRKILVEWKRVAKASGVFIQEVPVAHVLSHLTSYITKNDLPVAYQIEVSNALKNYRLFQTFGTWHDINVKVLHSDFRCPKCRNTGWLPEWCLDSERAPTSRILHPI